MYVIDFIAERLEKVKELGATPINARNGDPVEQIVTLRANIPGLQGRLRPGEKDKLKGVDCVIDAVGYQARDDKDYAHEKSTQVLDNMVRIVNPAGHIGIVGVYIAPDPGAPTAQAKQGVFAVPMAELFDKAVSVGMGQCPVKRYNEYLRELIITEHARPGRIVSHHIRIDQAPEAYKKFDQRTDGYTKVLIQFPGARAA